MGESGCAVHAAGRGSVPALSLGQRSIARLAVPERAAGSGTFADTPAMAGPGLRFCGWRAGLFDFLSSGTQGGASGEGGNDRGT